MKNAKMLKVTLRVAFGIKISANNIIAPILKLMILARKSIFVTGEEILLAVNRKKINAKLMCSIIPKSVSL
jgi:hypothetical protein